MGQGTSRFASRRPTTPFFGHPSQRADKCRGNDATSRRSDLKPRPRRKSPPCPASVRRPSIQAVSAGLALQPFAEQRHGDRPLWDSERRSSAASVATSVPMSRRPCASSTRSRHPPSGSRARERRRRRRCLVRVRQAERLRRSGRGRGQSPQIVAQSKRCGRRSASPRRVGPCDAASAL